MAGITKPVMVQTMKRDVNPCWKCGKPIPVGEGFAKTYGEPGQVNGGRGGKVMRFHLPCFRQVWQEEKAAFDDLLVKMEVEALTTAKLEVLDIYTTVKDPDPL